VPFKNPKRKREYMRDYMRARRRKKSSSPR